MLRASGLPYIPPLVAGGGGGGQGGKRRKGRGRGRGKGRGRIQGWERQRETQQIFNNKNNRTKIY